MVKIDGCSGGGPVHNPLEAGGSPSDFPKMQVSPDVGGDSRQQAERLDMGGAQDREVSMVEGGDLALAQTLD